MSSIALTLGNAQEKTKLSELSQLKAENLKLKSQLAQCNANLASFELTADQKKLQEEYRKELNANEKDVFDWNTLTFISPKDK